MRIKGYDKGRVGMENRVGIQLNSNIVLDI